MRTKACSKGIGNETPKGLPPKYSYDPHVSIIKLEESMMQKALRHINSDFVGKKRKVTRLEVTMEERDETGFGNFPIVLEIGLR
ncbi:hypothetical protein H6764_00285 [Candidatus Nomurabacteria bacterium]|nr:hypothetical protein [Candidatus Nomurabacteria bacterium]